MCFIRMCFKSKLTAILSVFHKALYSSWHKTAKQGVTTLVLNKAPLQPLHQPPFPAGPSPAALGMPAWWLGRRWCQRNGSFLPSPLQKGLLV